MNWNSFGAHASPSPNKKAKLLELGFYLTGVPGFFYNIYTTIENYSLENKRFESRTQSSVLCPLSSVLCPLSSVLCPLSSVLCPLSSVLCP
ncbi:hypothetical protein, partial [Leptospira borgpetersenii]|uniref:hypothetical protein n=1 Tax=Leptospira borgpetersenii TaxID=174 RepID=UPI001F3E7603